MNNDRHHDLSQLTPGQLARWLKNAGALDEAGLALVRELREVAINPTRAALQRAGRAAGYAANVTRGEAQQTAHALAGEIEEAAR